MAEVSKSVLFDLSRFSETIRRRLYDRIAEIQFARPEARHTPDEAGLQVVYFAGRWFAGWLDLEESPERPLALRFRLMRIAARPEAPAGFEMDEV